MVSVADCERVQTDWFSLRASQFGGRVWSDGPLRWVDGAGRAEPNVPARVVRQGARRPPFRRLGLGTALLSAVCRAAMRAVATHAVLNATPEGKLL